MKLNKLALTLIAAALLPTFAYAGTDAVATSFDRAFCNESFVNAYRTKSDQVAASFEREFGNESIVNAYRAKLDQVASSFERDMTREPVNSAAVIVGAADPLVEIFNAALYGKTDAVLASFERDMLGNAAVTAQDSILASFERDLNREPVAVAAAVTQGDDAFIVNEPDTLLANFYRELHWMPSASAVYVR